MNSSLFLFNWKIDWAGWSGEKHVFPILLRLKVHSLKKYTSLQKINQSINLKGNHQGPKNGFY